MEPLVSVIITAYNQAWCIEETINSVISQAYSNIEIIVVDDGSTDETTTKVLSFGGRVTYIPHDKHRGGPGAFARNTGIQAARGDFIAFLDGDDLWEPQKIATQVAAALQYPAAGLIAVDGVKFSHEDGTILSGSLFSDPLHWIPEGSVVQTRIYEELLRSCCIETTSQIMVPREVFNRIGLFNTNIQRAVDYDLFIRVAAKYDTVIIRRQLVRYRYHPSSVGGPLQQQHFRYAHTNIAIKKKHLMVAERQYWPFIKNQISNEISYVGAKAFEEGWKGKRLWASRFLLGLLTKNLRPQVVLLIVVYLARLWLPQQLVSFFRPIRQFLQRIIDPPQ